MEGGREAGSTLHRDFPSAANTSTSIALTLQSSLQRMELADPRKVRRAARMTSPGLEGQQEYGLFPQAKEPPSTASIPDPELQLFLHKGIHSTGKGWT